MDQSSNVPSKPLPDPPKQPEKPKEEPPKEQKEEAKKEEPPPKIEGSRVQKPLCWFCMS